MSDIFVAFDLDDTLYKEIDFVKSGFRFISNKISSSSKEADARFVLMWKDYLSGNNVFERCCDWTNGKVGVNQLLEWYRFHKPLISLDSVTSDVLNVLKSHDITLGLITDGRSITQRNKIESLGIDKFIKNDNIIISEELGSEKPCEDNYCIIVNTIVR